MEAIISLFKKTLETLRRFPQLFVFPALCWIAGLILQALIGGFALGTARNGIGLATAGLGFTSLAAIIVQLVAAYFSAGQVKGLLLANEGKALTPALFSEAYTRFGGRVLSAKLLRVGMMVGVAIIGSILMFVLSILGTLVAAIAAAAVGLVTVFWEVLIVRDDAQIQPALTGTYQVVMGNPVTVGLPLLVVVLAEAIVTRILGYIPGVGSFLSSLLSEVIIAPYVGLMIVSLLDLLKAHQTPTSA